MKCLGGGVPAKADGGEGGGSGVSVVMDFRVVGVEDGQVIICLVLMYNNQLVILRQQDFSCMVNLM